MLKEWCASNSKDTKTTLFYNFSMCKRAKRYNSKIDFFFNTNYATKDLTNKVTR